MTYNVLIGTLNPTHSLIAHCGTANSFLHSGYTRLGFLMFRKVVLSYRQVIPVCFDRVMQLTARSSSMIWLLRCIRPCHMKIAYLLFWGIKNYTEMCYWVLLILFYWFIGCYWFCLWRNSGPDCKRLLHCVLSCGTVYCNRPCLCAAFYVCVVITWNCVHRSSPNWVCR